MWALESISCKYQRLGFKIFGFCQDVVDWKIINFNLISAWSSPFDKIVLEQANYKIISLKTSLFDKYPLPLT